MNYIVKVNIKEKQKTVNKNKKVIYAQQQYFIYYIDTKYFILDLKGIKV
jgi:hypothetical protein